MTPFDKVHPFLISLVISLIVGIERERSHPQGSQAIGVRTFMLLGMSGTLAAFLQYTPFTVAIILFTGTLILLGYWRTSGPESDTGLTTEVSAIVVFGLGFLANRESMLALALGIAVFAILFSRTWLHRFSRETLRPAELQAALTIGVLVVGVIPFLPDHAIDPWNVINPRRLTSVISALAGIQFSSYVAVRMLGQKAGLMLSGFLGGLISSTSVFATLPPRVTKEPEIIWSVLAALCLAILATLLEAVAIVAMTAVELLPRFGIPVAAMCATCIAIALMTGRRTVDTGKDGWQSKNPLDLKSVLKTALLISTMLFLISLISRLMGETGTGIVSFLGGLIELQGVTFASATLFTQGQLSADATTMTLALAVVAAFISKFALLWILARRRVAILGSACLALILAVGTLTFWFSAGLLQ